MSYSLIWHTLCMVPASFYLLTFPSYMRKWHLFPAYTNTLSQRPNGRLYWCCDFVGNEIFTEVGWEHCGNFNNWRCINVVTTLQSRNFTKCLTMFFLHCVNFASANIFIGNLPLWATIGNEMCKHCWALQSLACRPNKPI